MDIKDLTLGQLSKLQTMFKTTSCDIKDEGFCVVVCDRGFIFIGRLKIYGEWAVIEKARCLRNWQSGKGLEYHIENGKTDKVTIDGKGTDRKLHISKLQNWANTDENKW